MMKNLILYFVAFLIVLVLYFAFVRKENKNELAKYYKITRPTLKKWVRYFDCGFSEDEWNKIRKLNGWNMASIKNKWGLNSDIALNKSQIADLASANPKTVSKAVRENLEKIGLTQEAWDNCSIFPPIICEKIMDILIGKPTNEISLQERLRIAVA